MELQFTQTEGIAVLNTALPASPTANSPYDVLNHKGYKYVLKSVDCTAATPISVFTVTGDVVMAVVGIVKTALTTSDAITAELGVAGATTAFIAQVADATGLAQHEIWHDATPDATIEAESVWSDKIVSNGQDVILTTTGTVTAGAITFYCRYYPLSTDGAVVAA
jgi:hypothetical protein